MLGAASEEEPQWWWADRVMPKTKHGPVTRGELERLKVAGTIAGNFLIWHPSMSAWTKLSQLPPEPAPRAKATRGPLQDVQESTREVVDEPVADRSYVLALRVIAETRIALFMFVTFFTLITSARSTGDDAACKLLTASCGNANSSAIEICAAQKTSALTLGMNLSEDWIRLVLACLICVTSLGLTVGLACTAPKQAKRSDVAMCFHLNQAYFSRPVQAMRWACGLTFAASIVIALAVRTNMQTFLAIFAKDIVAWVAAFLMVVSVHAPVSSLQGVTWEQYKRHIPGHRFKCSDLIFTAPKLLEEKLSRATLRSLVRAATNGKIVPVSQ